VRSILLAPGAYELPLIPALPVEIAPGGELAFEVRFAPVRAGVFRATLSIDGRAISFAASAYEPPLPEPLLSFGSGTFASGRQESLRVRFAEPARGNGEVKVTLAFTPRQGSPDDPAIQFIANSQRSLLLKVSPGDEALTWNGDPELIFQTGTTAGVLRFTVSYDNNVRTIDYSIAAAAPRLEAARIERTSSRLTVTLTGFDNARSMATLAFTWYHKDGTVIGGGPLVSQVGSIFATYFQNGAGGGTFSATATFPVSGSTENVTGLEIEAANGAGSTRASRVTF
jgi:hypothetical protein